MYLHRTIIFICILIPTKSILGEENGDVLPKPVQVADQIYEKAIDNANQVYDQAVTKAHTAYLEALEKAITQETKAGHLDMALTIRNIRNIANECGPPVSTNRAKKIDWIRLSKNSAGIDARNLESVALVESKDKNGWQRVPEIFKRYRSKIYVSISKDDGVADFEVIKDGVLFLACNFGYQGNENGNWVETRWSKDQFIKNGWIEILQNQLGGILVNNEGREQVVFMKQVKRGEKYRLRCNKYEPPHMIIFSDR